MKRWVWEETTMCFICVQDACKLCEEQ